jgi:hypothetical protein
MENIVKKWMYRVSKLAPAALLVAGVLVAGEAQAQERNCVIDHGDCSEQECIDLQDRVHAPDSCSSQDNKLSGCRKITGCANLTEARGRWQKCFTARRAINQRCFGGGNFSHNEKEIEAIQNAIGCDIKMEEDPPIGCGKKDPC